MKLILSFLLCFGISCSGTTMAAESPFYVGLKAGKMMVDRAEFEDATSMGLVFVGYKFSNNPSGSFAIEGEYTNSSSENFTIRGITGKWDIDTIAVYVAYRSGGDLYFKGKAGYLDEEVSANIVGASISGSDSGLSLGIGAGWKIGESNAFELEYTIVEEDISFLSLGFNFGF